MRPGAPTMNDFDPRPYLRVPVLTVATALALGSALLAAVPKKAPANVKKAARHLAATYSELKAKWSAEAPPTKDARAADRAIDDAWAALRARLEAASWLSAARRPQATRAARL